MKIAFRHPDRVDGVISIDAAPVHESGNQAIGSFAKTVLDFMVGFKDGTTRAQAMQRTYKFLKPKQS